MRTGRSGLAAHNFSKAIFNAFGWRKPSPSEHQSRLFSRKKTTGTLLGSNAGTSSQLFPRFLAASLAARVALATASRIFGVGRSLLGRGCVGIDRG